MRISDWSSDVCSSDLRNPRGEFLVALLAIGQPGIVGGIDDGSGRQQRTGGTEHGEAAEAAIEEEDGCIGGGDVHLGRLAGGRSSLNCLHHGFSSSRRRPGSHPVRSEEHTSELQSLMRISYAVFCLKKKKVKTQSARKGQNT